MLLYLWIHSPEKRVKQHTLKLLGMIQSLSKEEKFSSLKWSSLVKLIELEDEKYKIASFLKL